jgi:multiple sugar transport system permease protein
MQSKTGLEEIWRDEHMTAQVNFRNKYKKKKIHINNFKTILVTLAAIVFAFIFLLPTILTVTNSFMAASEISANYGSIFATTEKGGKVFISKTVNLKFIPDMVSFAQYYTVLFKSPEYLFKFWNSLIYVVPIVVFQLGIATLASYGFARYQGKIKNAIFFAYIIMMLMPYQVTLVPNFLVSKAIGIYGTKWAIWLPGIFSPFAVYLLTKFMRRIPTEVMEAASIDGADEWYIFSRICFPLCKGGIASIAILVFFDYWNMVEQPLILLPDPDMHPLSVFLSKINAGEISLAFAVAVIYLVPPLLIFLYGEDYLVEGISYQGGIKG